MSGARSGAIGLYLEHFGLRELPFSLTPDTSYFLTCPTHREALNLLLVALRSGEGFTKIVGEVGTGKTLLCRKLLRSLGDAFVTAYIPNPLLTSKALFAALADELAVEKALVTDSHRRLEPIAARLIELDAAGKRVVLLLDEAQALPEETLEAIRLLTNLETETRKLIHIVLFGQPELDARIARPSLRQLRQRITFAYRLRPLTRPELGAYVHHRLRVAGFEEHELFDADALQSLFRASRGVPRVVNILCHKALLAAYGLGDVYVSRSHVRAAVSDTEGLPLRTTRSPGWWMARRGTLAAALGAGANILRGGE